MLPLYKMLYDKDAPRFSPEAKVDILPIARWFKEELFTYVRVFGSLAFPHVLPLYVPDKLMAQEIAYQICGEGSLTKDLKEKKEGYLATISCGLWGLFTICCRPCIQRSKKHNMSMIVQISRKTI